MANAVTRRFRDVEDEKKDPKSFQRQKADTLKDKHPTNASIFNSDGEGEVSGDHPEEVEAKDVHT